VSETISAPEFIRDTRAYVSEYIKFADEKAGAVITFVTVLGASVGFAANDFLAGLKASSVVWYVVGVIVGATVLLCAIMTPVHALAALAPNTNSDVMSLAAFPVIANLPPDEYIAKVIALSPDDVVTHYAAHNVILSGIATSKFSAIAAAMSWLRALLFGVFVMLAIYAVPRSIG
jgi:hypothetical protein